MPARRLVTHRFVVWFTASKFFMDSIWYFITFWIGRYLADVYAWDLARIGLYAMFPFVVADLGNVLGGLFTQLVIRRGVPVPRARKLAVSIFALTMAAALLSGPLVIRGPRSALAVLAVAGFGWAAYTANTLAFPADVVPPRATATVWGLASVGAGLGGAFFQQASGLAIAHLRTTLGVAGAYHAVFVAYGLVALVGPRDRPLPHGAAHARRGPRVEPRRVLHGREVGERAADQRPVRGSAGNSSRVSSAAKRGRLARAPRTRRLKGGGVFLLEGKRVLEVAQRVVRVPAVQEAAACGSSAPGPARDERSGWRVWPRPPAARPAASGRESLVPYQSATVASVRPIRSDILV